jgi:ATP-dependent Clp protease ATP-binding subunit ClpC
MKKKTFVFTKDYMESLAYAGFFTMKHQSKEITSDDVILWIYLYTKKLSIHELFWKFAWFRNPQLLEQYIATNYQITDWVTKIAETFQLSAWFQQHFSYFQNEWIKKLNFLALFYGAIDEMSPQLRNFMLDQKIDIELLKTKLMKVVTITSSVDMSPANFFGTLEEMLKKLWLDLEQMDMFIDMGTIVGDDLDPVDIEEMMSAQAEFIDEDDDREMMTASSWGDTLQLESDNISNDKKDKKKKDKKLTIEYFSTDLTAEAKNNALDPVIWRDKEIDQIIYTLLRKTKNNPLLIGEAWVWKTAIVEWLATRIFEKKVPDKLQNKRVMMLDVGAMIAWTKYRGEFEARLKAVLDEAMDPLNNIIIFVDEIHTIIGAWSAEWTADAANMLKPLLSRGKIQMIWATTFDEYQKYIEKDPALKRRFQELSVSEPSPEMGLAILLWLKEKFEDFHGVTITDHALEQAVTWSVRYMMNKQLPDKAIDLLDEACARVSTLQHKLEENNEYAKTEKQIKNLQKQIEKAIEKQDYFKAAELKEQEEQLKTKIKTLRHRQLLPKHLRSVVNESHISQVLADKLWIPMDKISESEIKKLAVLDTYLNTKILWQEEAVTQIVKAVRRNRLSALERNKPIGSFLFLGPSGVGKTFLAKLLAKEYFGNEKSLIRVDMSEYMESYSVSKLIGSAPWYVGYDEWGMLTEQVRRNPYSVVLFDEIEKASKDVLNIMLQILDEWHLKDNKWRRIDFKNTIIILTSNIWSENFGKKQVKIGFQSDTWTAKKEISESDFTDIKENVLADVKQMIPAELLNRMSAQIVFHPLTKSLMIDIFQSQLKEFLWHWSQKHQGIRLPKYSSKKIATVIDDIYDPAYWARVIERYITDTVEPELIDQLLANA